MTTRKRLLALAAVSSIAIATLAGLALTPSGSSTVRELAGWIGATREIYSGRIYFLEPTARYESPGVLSWLYSEEPPCRLYYAEQSALEFSAESMGVPVAEYLELFQDFRDFESPLSGIISRRMICHDSDEYPHGYLVDLVQGDQVSPAYAGGFNLRMRNRVLSLDPEWPKP